MPEFNHRDFIHMFVLKIFEIDDRERNSSFMNRHCLAGNLRLIRISNQ